MYERTLEQEVIYHLPLIQQVIYRISIKSTEYDYEDLFNIGVIGLMDALKKYDRRKNVPFEAYARVRIKGTIIDEVRKNAKVSRYKVAALNEFYAARQQLEQEKNRSVTDQEVADFLGMNAQKLSELYESMHYLAQTSLEDTLFSHDEQGVSLQEMLPETAAISASDKLIQEEREAELAQAIKTLSEREQLILSLYYEQELTLKEIAEVLDLSTPRISQLHGQIILTLRKRLGGEV